MKYLLALATFLLVLTYARADVFELQKVDIKAKQYLPNGFNPAFVDGPTLNKGLDFNMSGDLFNIGYINTTVFSNVDQTQFRQVGLQYEAGIRLTEGIDIQYRHQSVHMLDENNPYKKYFNAKFEVEDSIEIVIHLYKKEYKPNLQDIMR